MLLELKMYFAHTLRTATFTYEWGFNKNWDTTLNMWLDKVESGELKAFLDDHRDCKDKQPYTINFTKEGFFKGVWITNKYYSYGDLYYSDKYKPVGVYQRHRPSIHTMIRLEKLVQKLEKEYKDSQKLSTEQLYK